MPETDDEAKEVGEDLKPEVMELVEVENENETKSEDGSDEDDEGEESDDNEDGGDNENSDDEENDGVDEKPEDKTEDVILESEEINYTNKDRRRTTIISIDKEELEDIFKDNTIDEEDAEVPEDKSETGSNADEDDEDTDEENEGMWFICMIRVSTDIFKSLITLVIKLEHDIICMT